MSSIYTIDFLHDLLGPLNSRCNQRLRPRAWLRIEEIFRRLQMAGHQDSRHDREHSFASLVHERSVSYSLFLRHAVLRTLGDLRDPHGIADPLSSWLSECKEISAGPNITNIDVSFQNDYAVLQLRGASGT